MSWPPPRTVRLEQPGRPWEPRIRSYPELGRGDTSALRYVVVDEIVGDWVGLSVSKWPKADNRGRLTFDLFDGPDEVGVGLGDLRSFLHGANATEDSGEPAIHIGTVFAADATGPPAETPAPLGRWLRNPCVITEEARKVAKLSFYGAVTPVLGETEAQDWNLVELEDE